MKLAVLAVLALVAATRADYHDDVFHFSTLRSPVTVRQPAYQRSARYENRYSADPSAYQSQYSPALSTKNAFFPQSADFASSNLFSNQFTPSLNFDAQYAPIAYQAPAQYTPLASYQAPAQFTPLTSYQVPAQYTPLASYQAPAQYAPLPSYQAPAQFAPLPSYQAPAEYNPAPLVDFKPTVAIQAPAVSYRSSPLASPHSFGNLYAGSTGSYAPSYNYRILKHVQEVDPSGPYRAHYATENGIEASEEGVLVGTAEGPAVAKQGSYSYTAPDGVRYTVNWVADENGFRASGTHLTQA